MKNCAKPHFQWLCLFLFVAHDFTCSFGWFILDFLLVTVTIKDGITVFFCGLKSALLTLMLSCELDRFDKHRALAVPVTHS